MRLWILFGGGVLILGAAIWPFSRKTEQLAPAPVAPAVAAKPAAPEPPKPEPAKIVEVIDLARAYEPVPEPDEPAGTVNPAAFIEVPEAPKPIPPAVDLGDGITPAAEQIDVMPRTVVDLSSYSFLCGEFPRPIPPSATAAAPVEVIRVMPREMK